MDEQKAIISVIGVDRVGIIYNVSKLLAESNVNILDISQTTLKDILTMIIPAPGKKGGDHVEFGGLLGHAPVMKVNSFSPKDFINRGGRIPAPLHSLNSYR
jgi:ACT domain.